MQEAMEGIVRTTHKTGEASSRVLGQRTSKMTQHQRNLQAGVAAAGSTAAEPATVEGACSIGPCPLPSIGTSLQQEAGPVTAHGNSMNDAIECTEDGSLASADMAAALYAALMPPGATGGTTDSDAVADLAGALAAWATGHTQEQHQPLQPGKAIAHSRIASCSSTGSINTGMSKEVLGGLGVDPPTQQSDHAVSESGSGDEFEKLEPSNPGTVALGYAQPSFGRWTPQEAAAKNYKAARGDGTVMQGPNVPSLMLHNLSKGMAFFICHTVATIFCIWV
jgi:hypothetical protein